MILTAHREPSCPVEPMPGRVIVKPESQSGYITKHKSGIYLVSSDKERPTVAPIVAIGDDTDNDDVGFTFQLGDNVLFSIHAGIKVSFGERGEEQYIVLKASEIIGRIVDVAANVELPYDKE